jgi:hypothetical protein
LAIKLLTRSLVGLCLVNNRPLQGRTVTQALHISDAHVSHLKKKLADEDIAGLIDQRNGQQQDYVFTSEIKSELIQHFKAAKKTLKYPKYYCYFSTEQRTNWEKDLYQSTQGTVSCKHYGVEPARCRQRSNRHSPSFQVMLAGRSAQPVNTSNKTPKYWVKA